MDKLFRLIFEGNNLSVREFADKTKLSKSTVHNKLKELKKRKILSKSGDFNYSIYSRFIKSRFYLSYLYGSGLIDYLVEEYRPSCIILFGSFAKGESVKESDIDIFIESSKKRKINLRKFEKKLKHEIQLFVESDIKKLPDELLNNVANGIKLFGFFDVR